MVREEEVEGREEKEEVGESGGETEKKRKGAHINTQRKQKPTKDRARGRYDLAACRYEHTNLSPEVSSKRKRRSFVVSIYEIYWCLPTHPGREGMIQYDYDHENLQGFLAILEI